MKKNLVLLTFTFFIAVASNGQCNVIKKYFDDGHPYLIHANEKIFANSDLEYGIQAAYAQMMLVLDTTKDQVFFFSLIIMVGAKGSKKMVVPRKCTLYFTDGNIIDLAAQHLFNPEIVASIMTNKCSFDLDTTTVFKIHNTSISKIRIYDNREQTELFCQPYKDLLKEEFLCLLSYE